MNAELNRELAVSIQTSLKSLLTEDVAKLSESLEGFGGSMVRDFFLSSRPSILIVLLAMAYGSTLFDLPARGFDP